MKYTPHNNLAGTHGKKKVWFDEKDSNKSMHVIGVPGTGKTKFLISQILQDIRKGKGLCFIDPHGEATNEIVERLSAKSERLRERLKVVLLEPGSPTWCFGFNPFAKEYRDQGELDYHIESLMETIAKIWEKRPLDQPIVVNNMLALFHALAENNLNLADSYLFFDPKEIESRLSLTKNIKNHAALTTWNRLNGMSKKNYDDDIGGPLRKVMINLFSTHLKNIFSQNTLRPFREYMDEGAIILVNMSPQGRFSETAQDILAGFLINEIYREAFQRKSKRPFSLVIDECHRYLTGDISRMIMELRKFNVSTVLAHQNLAQLGEPGTPLRESILAGCQTKVVFGLGGATRGDATLLADSIFKFDPMKVKTYRQEVIGHEIRIVGSGSSTESEQTAQQVTRGVGLSFQQGTTETKGVTDTEGWSEADHSSSTTSTTTTTGKSGSSSRSTTHGSSESFSESESEVESWNTAEGEIHSGEAPVHGMTEDEVMEAGGDILLSTSTSEGQGGAYVSTTSHGVTNSFSETESESSGWSTSVAIGASQTRGSTSGRNGSQSKSRTKGNTITIGQTLSLAESESTSEGRSKTKGWSQTFVPILAKVPGAFLSIQEQLYQAAVMLRDLAPRICFIKLPGMPNAIQVRTPNVKDLNLPRRMVMRYRAKILNREDELIRFDDIEVSDEAREAFWDSFVEEFDETVDGGQEIVIEEQEPGVLPESESTKDIIDPSDEQAGHEGATRGDDGYADFDITE